MEQRTDLAEIVTIEQFFADYPRVTRRQAVQFLQPGKDRLLACVS